MSADIKLSKAQIKKVIMSGGALGTPAISLGKNILAHLASKITT